MRGNFGGKKVYEPKDCGLYHNHVENLLKASSSRDLKEGNRKFYSCVLYSNIWKSCEIENCIFDLYKRSPRVISSEMKYFNWQNSTIHFDNYTNRSKNIKSNDFTIKIHAVTLLLFTVSNNAKFMKTKFIDNGFRQLLDPVIFFSVKGQSREGEEGMILKGGICRPKGGRKVDFQIFALKFWLFPFKGTSIPWKSHWEQTSHTLVSKEGKASGRADHGESRIRENVPMDLCAFCKGKEFSSWQNTR